MRKPPFNRPVFGGTFSGPFGRVFGEAMGGGPPVFSPLDIPDLLAWYDATDASTISESGGDVSAWDDKSGNNNTLIQTLTPDKPTTGTQTINGLNTIAFDGVLQNLTRASITPSVNPNLTIAIVFNVISATANNDSILSMDATNDFQIDTETNPNFLGKFDSVGLNLDAANVENPSGIQGNDVGQMYRLSTADSSLRLFDASGQIAEDVGNYNGALDATQVLLIASNRAKTLFIECKIGEITIYNRDLNAQERADIFNYFSRWGV